MKRRLIFVLGLVSILLLSALSAEARQVTYWVWGWGEHMQQGIDKALALFERENPGITVEKKIWGSTEKLIAAVAAGSPPDLVLGAPGHLADLLPLDALEPLSERYARTDLWSESLLPGLRQTSVHRGVEYGVPGVAVYPLDGLAWNATFFAEAGLQPLEPDEAITWEEMADLARKLVKRDHDGTVTRLGWHPLEGRNTNPDVIEAYFDLTFFKDDRPQLDAPDVIAAFDFLNESFVQPCGAENVLGLFEGGWYRVAQGLTAMVNLGSYAPAELRSRAPEFEFGVTWHPSIDGVKRQQIVAWQNMIPRGASEPEAAWKLAVFLATSVEAQAAIYESTGFFGPARDFPAYYEFDDPLTMWYVNSMSEAQAVRYQLPFPYGQGIPSVWPPYNEAKLAIFRQEQPPKIALAQANDAWLVEIRRAGSEK